ncbi:choline/ethanolamine kinase family protein [Microbacterium sp. NPDC079995]|uniref:choline/ethanolamine kinase family protein n=1 Tax=unclassified Microbacterium TaxID=2609290 RepID=UPI00344D4B40
MSTIGWHGLGADALASALPALAGWRFGDELRMERISSGTTNVNWRMITPDGVYFLKVPGLGAEAFVNRAVAHEAAVVAASTGVGPEVLYLDPSSGIEVCAFLTGYRSSTAGDLLSPTGMSEVMRLYRRLHAGQQLSVTKTLFDMIDEHRMQIAEVGRDLQPYQLEVQERWQPIQERYIGAGLEIVPGHNDPNPPNFMVKAGAPMMLIDFDYAANTDRYYELGAYLTIMGIPDALQSSLFEQYAGTTPTEGQLARLYLSGIGTLVKWGHWALYNSVVRDVDFDYEKYGAGMLLGALTMLRSDRCREAVEAL